MRAAVKLDDVLGAPSVGTWRPVVGVGAPLGAGDLLGRLFRDGRPLDVRVPQGVTGVVVAVAKSGAWVAYGDLLVQTGTATGPAASASATVVTHGGPEGATAVRSETDGTLYLSPDPKSPPFVAVGATVDAHDTLGLVEVMKTFTPVRAPFAGVLVQVDAGDGASVLEGETLFWIRPS